MPNRNGFFSLPDGRAMVTFETPYSGRRCDGSHAAAKCQCVGVQPGGRNGKYNRVQFHAWTGSHAVYHAMARATEANRMQRDAIEAEMQLWAPEPDGRQYAVSRGGMRVRVK